MRETTILDDKHTFEEFGFIPLFAQSQPKIGELSLNSIKIGGRAGFWHFGTEIGGKSFQIPLGLIEPNDQLKEEKIEKLVNFFIDSRGQPRPVKIAFRRTPDKFVWVLLQGVSDPEYTGQTASFALNVTQPDPYKYGLSSMYDLDQPLRYDQGHEYGVLGYPNTKKFNWNIVPHHYSGLENYCHLETPIKITIQGTIRNGSIKHLETDTTFHLPDITNGRITIDTEMFNLNVNGVDVLEFEGDFFDLVSGGNGFQFSAEQANAVVNFDWLHRFV